MVMLREMPTSVMRAGSSAPLRCKRIRYAVTGYPFGLADSQFQWRESRVLSPMSGVGACEMVGAVGSVIAFSMGLQSPDPYRLDARTRYVRLCAGSKPESI